MRTSRRVGVSGEDRKELERLVRAPTTEQRVALRARIVLLSGEGVGTGQLCERLGTTTPTVTRWRGRYEQEGVRGLLKDAPRSGRLPTISKEKVAEVVRKAEKAAQPAYDPRWKPFSACMTADGYDVRADSTQPFGQQDLDTIVAGANAQLPNPDANKRIGGNTAGVPGIAGAFLRCGGRWLAWAPEAYGLARLEPGQVPAP